MFKKKCSSCAKQVEKKFSFCPYCGLSFKERQENEDFGMLGRNDSREELREELRLPRGMEKIMNSLIKQLEKQMGNMDSFEPGKMPRGFSVRISTGKPKEIKQVVKRPVKIAEEPIALEEKNRRNTLKKIEALYKIKRLGDKIIYEIDAPGIQKKSDVVITKLESGIEIKVYTADACYVKVIPLEVELIGHYVENEKVFVEFKG